MANFSKTISNVVNAFGAAPSDKWAEYNWNAFKWGDGTNDLQVLINHFSIDNTVTFDTAYTLFPGYNRTLSIANSLLPDTTMVLSPGYNSTLSIANVLAPVADMYSESMQDGSGYYYVIPSDTTNFENRATPTYVAGTPGSTAWTSMAASSTSWS